MDRRMQDCYFFYYSTCTKGEHCGFRHEPSALGCETVCQFWQQGKCTNQQCHLRHMELKKNRKTIPCYWENQPTGCRKPHCPFLHKAVRDVVQGSEGERKDRVDQAVRPRPEQQQPNHQAIPPPHQGMAPNHQGIPPTHQGMPPPHQGMPPTHQGMPPTHQTMPEPLIVSFQDSMHLY